MHKIRTYLMRLMFAIFSLCNHTSNFFQLLLEYDEFIEKWINNYPQGSILHSIDDGYHIFLFVSFSCKTNISLQVLFSQLCNNLNKIIQLHNLLILHNYNLLRSIISFSISSNCSKLTKVLRVFIEEYYPIKRYSPSTEYHMTFY